MRVLFLTCDRPGPRYSCGQLREQQLLARLCERHDVHVAAATTTPAVRDLLRERHYDVLHVEGFRPWQHVSPWGRPPAVLVEPSVEWRTWAQRGRAAEAAATRAAEVAAWCDADVLAALSDEDANAIEAEVARAVRLVPNGADHLTSCTPRARPRRVVVVGDFARALTVDGAMWFASEVLPLVRGAVPDLDLQLVGASPPAEICALAGDGIEITGRVPDVGPYLEEAALVLCPLRHGSGVKLTMLEALACRKAIVTTSPGCEGLASARAAMRVEDSAGGFAAAVIELLSDDVQRARLESAAAEVALPTWDEAADALEGCWRAAERLSLAVA